MRQYGKIRFAALALVVMAAFAILVPAADAATTSHKEDGKISTIAARQLRGQNHFSAGGGEQATTDEDLLALEDMAYWDRYLQDKKDGSFPPSPGPGPSPTVCNGITEEQRKRRILAEITASGVSSRQDLADDRSAQGMALDWITNEDEAELCPDDNNLIQRYIMAVFYYSTDGDRWAECSAGSPSARAEDDSGNADVEEEKVFVILEENSARGDDDDDDEQLTRTGGGNKDKKGETNCLKYCRDRCCTENGGDRLCGDPEEQACRADCFVETTCDWKEAREELEKDRKKRDSDSRDRNNSNKNDKRKRKNSRKGGRNNESKGRRLQNAPCGAPNSGFPGKAPYLSESSECEWAGSSCDGKDISIIGFEGNNLGGTFPAEILALNKLRNLTLEGGRTSGTIPEEWGSGVWSGDSLQVLDLDQNKLSGPVSDNLFNLQTLKVLDIDENRLEGTLSPRVGRLTNLVFVEFEDNNFEGQIPDTFSKLKKLRTATFRGNGFSGSMPEAVCDNRVPDGLLNILTADCAGNEPKIECDCCSSCF